MLVEGKKTRVCFLQSKRHTPGTCSSMEEEGEEEGGVMSPLSSSLPYIRVSLRGCCLRAQPVVMEICSSEETSAGPSCSLLLRAGQTSNSGEIVQLLRCRGVFPALQLEREKSRAITGPRHLPGTEHAAWRLPLGVSEPKHSSGVIRRHFWRPGASQPEILSTGI